MITHGKITSIDRLKYRLNAYPVCGWLKGRSWRQIAFPAAFLIGAGIAVTGNLPRSLKPQDKSWQKLYGFSVSREEALEFGNIVSKEKFSDQDHSVPDVKPNGGIWTVNGRKFWINKSLLTWTKSHVDANGNPLKNRCMIVFVWEA